MKLRVPQKEEDYLTEIFGSQNEICFTESVPFFSNVEPKTVSNMPANAISS